MVYGVITEAAHIYVEDITLAGIRKTVSAFETTQLKKKFARYHKENTRGNRKDEKTDSGPWAALYRGTYQRRGSPADCR